MTNAVRTTATKRVPMDSTRKIALFAGVLYLITFISIPRLFLYGPVLNDPNYIVSSLSDTGVLWGAVLEMIVAVAIVGTGVALFSVLKPHNEGVALGFVAARVFEAGVIVVGIISLLCDRTWAPRPEQMRPHFSLPDKRSSRSRTGHS